MDGVADGAGSPAPHLVPAGSEGRCLFAISAPYAAALGDDGDIAVAGQKSSIQAVAAVVAVGDAALRLAYED